MQGQRSGKQGSGELLVGARVELEPLAALLQEQGLDAQLEPREDLIYPHVSGMLGIAETQRISALIVPQDQLERAHAVLDGLPAELLPGHGLPDEVEFGATDDPAAPEPEPDPEPLDDPRAALVVDGSAPWWRDAPTLVVLLGALVAALFVFVRWIDVS